MANKRKKPKGKVIDILPKALKPALDKPRLREITFQDLITCRRQLGKMADQVGLSDFYATACGLCCTKWGA
jgi:hypothetical protein